MSELNSITGSPLRRVRHAAGWGFVALTAWLGASGSARAAAVDFQRDILPILSDKCFHCHGPDEKARKAKLRLDTPEGAFQANAKGKVAIVRGKSTESELFRRLVTSDADDLMPPPESNRTLTLKQKEQIRDWIDSGAKWERHWAFQPIVRPQVPMPKDSAWARGPIDRFVLAKLEAHQMKPAPPADRERWLRRVTLDLTGLPPSLKEVDAFLADRAAGAEERVVDRLLGSPRFGERMATDWLDLARYSDTHGFQMDRYRPMWPWRDWVIRSFNRNLPFDKFVTWQLAGDLLPNPTQEQRLATAFNRNHLQNEEGGIVAEEFRVSYVVDRVNTFGSAFLGMTFECSRCHDHKYDPISQRDFYQLFSMFQNIDESGQTVYFGEIMPVPTLLLANEEESARIERFKAAGSRLDERRAEVVASTKSAFEAWLAQRPQQPSIPGLVASYAFDGTGDARFANGVQGGKPASPAEAPASGAGRFGEALLLSGENGVTLPGAGPMSRTEPFSLSVWLNPPGQSPRWVVLHKSRAWMDAGSRGFELLLEDGHVSVGLHHMWPGNSLRIRSRVAVPTNSWSHVAITYDGSSRASGLHLYLDGKPAEVEVVRDGLWKDITYGGGEPDLTIGFRMRDSGFKGGRVDELRVFNRELSALESAHLAGDSLFGDLLKRPALALSPAERSLLFDHFCTAISPEMARWREDQLGVRQELNRLVMSIPDIMVMQELPTPKPAHILRRGAYDAPGEAVTAGVPAALPPLPAGAPANRLGLARWLLAPENPLMARVTVNRAWQMMFGRGLVETADNFGTQGAPPTHPELLDWMARDFMDGGWDWKHLLREIALSSTYRQSSKAGADLLAADPQNDWLARGPARRLTAEMLRDQALAVSGLLSETVGGPSVKPYQPEGLWEVAMGNPRYDQGHGAELHRRSLYTYWKRTVPPPAMVTFDAAERNACVVRRQSTSTPLQALALLNDPQIVEAARHVAERMYREAGPTDAERVSHAFRLVTGRRASEREAAVLVSMLQTQRARFRSEPAAASRLLGVGEARNSAEWSEVDLASGAVLAEALLNHDEAILRR
jgi:hypothetical protein